MNSTSETPPARRMPMRAAKVRHAAAANPTTPRTGRVTRSLSSLSQSSASKRPPSPQLTTSSKRSRRERLQFGYYEEPSGDDGAELDDPQPPGTKDELVRPVESTPTKAKTGNQHAQQKTKKTRGTTAATKHTPAKVSQKSKIGASTLDLSKLGMSTQSLDDSEPPIILPWATLPYFVLVCIFECAAGTPLTSSSAKWLLGTSLVCRAFTEPALTVLYRRPPLLTLQMAHGFVHLLSKSPRETLFNYRQKVEALEIDVGTIASKAFKGRHLDLKALFQNVPRLMEAEIWHEKDQPPYRDLDKNIKWTYPPELFNALGIGFEVRDGEVAILPMPINDSFPMLRSWLWSRRMMVELPLLTDIHRSSAFRGLRKLAFTNYQLMSLNAANPEDPEVVEEDNKLITRLAQCIAVLPDLKHLVFECSTVVNGQFLSLLPKSIEHLELINCWEVKADHLAEYLLSHGSGIRHLTLHHNQSLSLAFLPVLGNACPLLESLRMNLTYFNLHEFYRDSDPLYDKLLTAEQVPTWPASLRHLDLKNLRHWDGAAAEAFLQSLLGSAPNLPMLRHLEIKAMLDIPFRERSLMRDKWEAKLKKVFLRKWVDPKPHFTLRPKPLGTLPAVVPAQTPKKRRNKRCRRRVHDPAYPETPSPRRSSRIATLPSASSSRASSVGRDMRDSRARPFYAEPDTDEDIIGDEDDENQSSESEQSRRSSITDQEPTFIQGLCDVVDIRFDNQKPVENQWRMDDFLDSEDDDPTDDDWDGDNESDQGYAW